MKRYFRTIIKYININVVSLLLSVVYILLIIPYRFFFRKNNGKWMKNEQEMDTDFKYMW